jgi:hypothetical protein
VPERIITIPSGDQVVSIPSGDLVTWPYTGAAGTLSLPPVAGDGVGVRKVTSRPKTVATGDLLLTGTISPNCTGRFVRAGILHGHPYYVNGAYFLWYVFESPYHIWRLGQVLNCVGTDPSIKFARGNTTSDALPTYLSSYNGASGTAYMAAESVRALPLPKAALDGSARRMVKGHAAITLPRITKSSPGSGERVVKSSGSPSLPSLGVDGFARRDVSALADLASMPVAIEGSGNKTVKATGVLALETVGASGEGHKGVNINDNADQVRLPGLGAQASGVRTVQAHGAASIAPAALRGEGKVSWPGSTIELPALALTATARFVWRLGVRLVMPRPAVDGAARRTVKGRAALKIAVPEVANNVLQRTTRALVSVRRTAAQGRARRTVKGRAALSLPRVKVFARARLRHLAAAVLTLVHIALRGGGRVKKHQSGSGRIALPASAIASKGKGALALVTALGSVALARVAACARGRVRAKVRGSGRVALPLFRVRSRARRLLAALGELAAAALAVLARGKLVWTSPAEEVALAPARLGGAGKRVVKGHGSIILPRPRVAGVVKPYWKGWGGDPLEALPFALSGRARRSVRGAGRATFAPIVSGRALKKVYASGAASIAPAEAYAGVRNKTRDRAQLYRVVALRTVPGAPYKQATLEAVTRPLDQ